MTVKSTAKSGKKDLKQMHTVERDRRHEPVEVKPGKPDYSAVPERNRRHAPRS